MKRIKDDELIRIKRETSVIQDDLNMVENLLENIQQMKIVEGDQDNKDSSNDQDKAAIVPSIVKTEGKGASTYYVTSILGIFGPPPPPPCHHVSSFLKPPHSADVIF